MSGTQVPSALNPDHRIAQLDEGAARIIRFHSGTKPDGRILLLKALEDYYRCFPNVPVIKIHRRPSSNGRQGAMDNVECGICSQSGKFQKIAEHIVNEHFKLTLWSCGEDSCSVVLSRKSDRDRHLLKMHKIDRPRERKAKRRSHDFTSSPPTQLFSPGPGPTRHSRLSSRSSEFSTSPRYSMHSVLADGSSRGDIINWPDDNAPRVDIQRQSSTTHQDAGGRFSDGRLLRFDRGIHPTLVLPGNASPTDHVPSLPDESYHQFYPNHSRSSSSGRGVGTSSGVGSLSDQEAARALLPTDPRGRVGPSPVFNGHCSSNFLAVPPCTPAASSLGIGLLPRPAPVHRVTTPIQSRSIHLGMYQASNLTEGMQLPLPPSYPHYSSIRESSPSPMASFPMTFSPHYYPPSAQINMPNALPTGSLPTGHWVAPHSGPPSRSHTPYSVDENFAFGLSAPDALFSHDTRRQ